MATKKELEETLKNLVEKINYISNHPSFKSQFTMGYIHGSPYDGPSWREEMDKAQKLLGMPKELPKPKYPVRLAGAWKTSNVPDWLSIDLPIFKGTWKEVHNWIDNQPNPNQYYMCSIDEFSETEVE